MIKGTQRQMIVVRTGSSSYFSEAYFVLRQTADRDEGACSEDMLQEANRIIADCIPKPQGKKRRSRKILLFCLGLLIGAVSSALLLWLLF